MSLTPADVHNVAFSKPPIGKRGYNEDEVDAFLDLVETELARLIEDNNELRQQVEQLDAELESTRSELESAKAGVGAPSQAPPRDETPSRRLAPVPPPSSMEQTQAHGFMGDSGEPNVQAAKVLGLAQEMADRLTAEAKTESDGMLAEARTKSEQLLSDARSKADSMVNEARTRAETMLNDARTRTETLERQARDKATTLDREAQRKYTETMNNLNAEKSSLNKKIEELRTIEREYRTRLRGFLESQLRELDDRGSAAPASASSSGSGQSGSGSAGGGSGQGYSFGPRAEAG
ncbi:cell division initiation protein [Prauserella sp. PE36]|uniref:Cell wall synthesis protein Wag31 n=1 Tax=Prauserella endophytica TaxID=1592324 RepID=A0ABY2RZI9_9PSEU|nr:MULTISPECIES: DivIVA domain-containing protein [Prauserella]PXY24944.1 cell division initiation protein [Prauserella coralliicola]RBM20288.1 cell division initiation protein [Prauserella sp. PE36]TKG66702.1 DivIVA domain-containing protein [Prauserella endophytica]